MRKSSRRKFIQSAAVVAAAPALLSMDKPKQQIIHHVFFWLKEPGDASRNELIKGLQTLKPISVVKQIWIGTPASTEKRDVVDNSYHVSLLLHFDTVKDEEIYQVHPTHKAFVSNYSHLWEKVVVYDMLAIS